jgi:hypothetical protein
MNPRELVEVKAGAAGWGDAPGGTCLDCASVEALVGEPPDEG